MDLNSLPGEMLVIILKYADFHFVRRVRKMSRRIDQVARRAAFGFRIPVKRFSVFRENGNVLTSFTHERPKTKNFKTKFSGYLDPNVCRLWTYSYNRQNLEHALSNVTILNELDIRYCAIENEFLEMLKRQQKSLRDSACEVEFMIDANDAKYLLQSLCPKLESLEITIYSSNETMGLRNLCNSEVLGCRNWKNLNLGQLGSPANYLNDEFLLAVAPKCQEFSSTNNDVFTVMGAIELLKNCLPENDHVFDLNSLRLGDVPFAEVKRVIQAEFPDAKITAYKMHHFTSARTQIAINHPINTHILRFTIYQRW